MLNDNGADAVRSAQEELAKKVLRFEHCMTLSEQQEAFNEAKEQLAAMHRAAANVPKKSALLMRFCGWLYGHDWPYPYFGYHACQRCGMFRKVPETFWRDVADTAQGRRSRIR